MKTASLSEFGALFGVSKQAVHKWKARGLLALCGNRIDVSASMARLAEHGIDPEAAPARDLFDASGDPLPGPTDDDDEVDETISAAADFAQKVLAGQFPSVAEADRVRASAMALRRLLEARQMSGELMERRAASSILFDEGRRVRDAITAWPVQVAPHVAGELGVDADQVAAVLEMHVNKLLIELAGAADPFAGESG